jgi:hypothetical protein
MWWIILAAGILALLWAWSWGTSKATAPLNQSGYTYSGTPGA